MTVGGKAHRTIHVTAIIGVGLLLLAWAFLPGLAANAWAAPQASTRGATVIPPITQTWPGGERRLPLVQPDGLIAQRFPHGVPERPTFSQEDPAVLQLLTDLADAAGLGGEASTVLAFDPEPYYLDPANGYEARYTYPYAYPKVDPAVARAVTAGLVAERAPQLVELTSALVFTNRAPAAYSILNRMRQFANTCEIQLNLAQTVALGFKPDRDNVDHEFGEAQRLCTDDPIAYAAHARAALAFDTRGWEPYIFFKVGELDQEDAAVALAREAQARFPDHAGGYLTEAAILLEVADEYAMVNRHPFTARSMFQRALTLLEAVRDVQGDDPSVTFGIARAQAGLGQRPALPDLDPFVTAFERGQAASASTQWALNAADAPRAHDYAQVVDSISWVAPLVCRSLNQSTNDAFTGSVGLPEPGWRGNCNVRLLDATGGMLAGGADSLWYVDYIPTYRTATPDTDVIAVLADRQPDPDSRLAAAFTAAQDGRWGDLEPWWFDSMQDAYRRLGQFDRAEALIRDAMKADAADPLTLHDRLGEVLYLQGNYADAAREFAVAAEVEPFLAPERPGMDQADQQTLHPDWAVIKQATALAKAGRDDEARTLLTDLVLPPEDSYDWRPASQELARSTMLGLIEMRAERWAEASKAFEKAYATCPYWADEVLDPCRSGVQENNYGIALLQAGDPAKGAELLKAAITRDPANPLFVEGLANNLEAAGDIAGAAEIYRLTIANDPTQFTAHNNLGVIVAQQGDLTTAVEHFRAAIAGNPHYPTGWFNLGVAWSRTGDLGDAVRSQGAFGRASQLHAGFRNAEPEFVTDKAVYDPGLDLSKPLPADWQAGTHRKPPPVAFSIPMLLTSVLLIGRALISDNLYGRIVEGSLGWTARFARPGRRPLLGETLAVLVCAFVLGLGLATTVGWTPWLTAAAAVGALLISVAFVAARRLLAPSVAHRGTVGGTLVGLVGAPFGVSFAPVPVLDDAPSSRLARWTPAITMGAMAALALALTAVSGVPLVRGFAQALLLVVSSSLVPIAPFDGTHVDKRWAIPLAVALAAPTVAFAAAWL